MFPRHERHDNVIRDSLPAPAVVALRGSVALSNQIVDRRRRVEERTRGVAAARALAAALETRASGPRSILPPQPGNSPIAAAESSAAGTASLTRGSENKAAKPVVPVIDVQRLTDQVVRQIDQRIIALRERLGKAF